MTDFDKVYTRRNTNSVKWDTINQTYNEENLLPMWVADMDFKVNEPVLKALKETIDHGILGYIETPNSLYDAIQNWQKRHHNYSIEKEAILFNSGVVPSISLAIQAYTSVGDAVMIHDPVYPPFATVVQKNRRKLIRTTLIEENGHFVMNYDEIERLIRSESVKLFVLCNPHNPGGRVWHQTELEMLGNLCAKYNVIVVSDEIHQDLIFSPNVFTTFANAHPTFKDFSITLTAATKTFNLAGIKNSMVFIENPDLREKFSSVQQINQQHEINTFGYIGTEAAYVHGDQWLDDLLKYLTKNITLVSKFLASELPNVKMMKPEGTYLIWLDFSTFNLTDQQIQNRLIHEGKVVLNPGISFGPAGTQHMRLNVACSKEVLVDGLNRIKRAFQDFA
ncbi:MalY/PatB family protein [Enterococcus rivorum]|uniref:cysteine-S-conjugate beta-lyase n=1 Tax=Enterococcus rivorum TaxID=762845 RepID=A0A1E5KT81_9ENTE|nr:MalY/PatB family protein [Enterococcus rivorum]MBP2100775.1 cystathionine beta-lyase [Enterococcus rivorum]OEH81095.1 aminotransferase class I/II [Enterococcus rivorum]